MKYNATHERWNTQKQKTETTKKNILANACAL